MVPTISFSCPHCNLKIKVKPEHAGKSTSCPTCKKPLTVPMPSATVPWTPPQQIDGEESSLAKMGHAGGVTLEHDPAGRKPTALPGQKPQRSVGEALANRNKSSERYVIEGEIARGGMGAVLRAVDSDLRREVAVKYMLDDKDPKKKARFIEEAQINAQLEHPNIVPVYDLRIDAQKRPYLMMKMVKGRDLKSVLNQLRTNPKQAEKEYSLGRLLNVIVNICNGLAFAHAHGVVHRDLKPANIMLGDFGEVYIMDWGLAKVLKGDGASRMESGPPVAMPGSTSVSAKRSSKVATNREGEADLTQEGSILGTPVYMPPEQANGNLQAIDQRSDVYSLGAILYEILTLQPPIDKEGGYMAILMRVLTGEIVPPEERVRRTGGVSRRVIPPELSAIAMKALAKEPANRYSNVEALRKDIERFQEGRSVSAKEDTKRELIWKFVKRNKAFSAAAAACLLALIFSLGVVGKSWWATERAYAEYRGEQSEKDKRTRRAVPAFVRAARQLAGDGAFDEALVQVDFALEYERDNPDARLLKGQVLIAQKNFAAGRAELEQYLRQRPSDGDARMLAELCKGKTTEPTLLFAMAEILQRQKSYSLAARLLQDVNRLVEARKPLLELYRKQIDAAWPGLAG